PAFDQFSNIKPYSKPELPDLNKIPLEPEEDLLYFIIQYGSLQEWEKNLLQIVRKETAYFIPQIETKIMNEGWASYWHYNILKELKLPDELYLEFIKRHNDVIAPGVGWLNPYFIGFKIFEALNEKYGRDKIFEVRKLDRDESFLRRYLTEELCHELNLFQYGKVDSSYIIQEVSDEEGWMKIRNTLCSNCGMGMIPLIRVVDVTKEDKTIMLEHVFDGRELNMDYARSTLKYVAQLWGHSVKLKSRQHNMEVVMQCDNK
ncbi:MAG: SpoVR family protein, partial [Bacillota bacterium]|nr:SpoVR family protein [Bacillota bacterium]